MPTTYKVLGQVSPVSSSTVPLYTVSASTSAVISTLSVCNYGSASGTFRVSIRPGGEAEENKHFIIYDPVLVAKDSIFLTLGITVNALDVVSVVASTSGFSFNIFGSEIK